VPFPLELIVLATVVAQWLVTGLRLGAVGPVLVFLLGIDPAGYGVHVAPRRSISGLGARPHLFDPWRDLAAVFAACGGVSSCGRTAVARKAELSRLPR